MDLFSLTFSNLIEISVTCLLYFLSYVTATYVENEVKKDSKLYNFLLIVYISLLASAILLTFHIFGLPIPSCSEPWDGGSLMEMSK